MRDKRYVSQELTLRQGLAYHLDFKSYRVWPNTYIC